MYSLIESLLDLPTGNELIISITSAVVVVIFTVFCIYTLVNGLFKILGRRI